MKEADVYLNFNGNCREAMKFYAASLEAELQLMSFGDVPGTDGKPVPKEMKDRIMHARLSKGRVIVMASDAPPGGKDFRQGNNFSIALNCDSAQELDKAFSALAQKGNVVMPPQETFWAARFGMLTDQFGINWMLNVDKPQQR